jgi:hypothetical protein
LTRFLGSDDAGRKAHNPAVGRNRCDDLPEDRGLEHLTGTSEPKLAVVDVDAIHFRHDVFE